SPRSPPYPYTTLFRSCGWPGADRDLDVYADTVIMAATAAAETAALATARHYIDRAVADDQQREALFAQVVACQPQDTASAMCAVHAALAAAGTTADDDAEAAATSVAARIRADFPDMPPRASDGSYRGASMPALARWPMAPPNVDRRLWRFLDRFSGARRKDNATRRRARPLRRILFWRQFLLALLVFLPAAGATGYMASVLPHGGTTWLELLIDRKSVV